MRIAFRICVDTLRGAKQGLPVLLKMLAEHQVKASFALSLGPERQSGGLAISLAHKFSPARHQIANNAKNSLLAIQQAGHEIGMAAFDPSAWIAEAGLQNDSWTEQQFEKALAAFNSLFSQPPVFHAASNWQGNPALLSLEERYAMKYASDVRGKTIFFPKLQDVTSSCPQVPTTLPSIDEVLNRPGVTQDNVHEYIFAESQRIYPHGEVFSINAESEHLTIFEKLIVMWKGSQWDFMTMGELLASNNLATIGQHQIGWGRVADNGDDMLIQSLPVVKE